MKVSELKELLLQYGDDQEILLAHSDGSPWTGILGIPGPQDIYTPLSVSFRSIDSGKGLIFRMRTH